MKIASLDTETKFDNKRNVPIPFIATSTDTQLKSTLFDLSKPEDYEALKALAESSDVNKIFHNAVYDILCLSNIGINVCPPYEDTMLMATLLNENFDSKKLKVLAKVHLNEDCNEADELSKVKAKYKRELKKIVEISNDKEIVNDTDESDDSDDEFDYSYIPTDILYPYAIKDAIYTIKLYFLFRKHVYENYSDIYEFEKSLIPVIVTMIKNGFRIDREFIKKMLIDYELEAKQVFEDMIKFLNEKDVIIKKQVKRKTEKGIVSQAEKIGIENVINIDFIDSYILTYSRPFKPGSSDDLRFAIEKLELPVTKVTGKKQQIATDKETLKSIPKDVVNYKFIEYLIRWRFLTKQTSTYYGPLLKRYTSNINDIAHFIFYQSGAKSGRFTAKLVQTIPRKDEVDDERFIRHIRKAFIPRNNKILIAIDYDQIEMRIFADFSNCIKLIDAINNGYDAHSGTAEILFGKEYLNTLSNERRKHFRRIAKNINFGLIYGMGKNKLARSLGVPMHEAFDIIGTYHKNFPVKEHIAEQTGLLYKKGIVSIIFDSQLMKLRRDYHVPQELSYRAVNIRIQGAASYFMRYGIKRSVDWIAKEKLHIPFICNIHDELFFEIDEHDYSEDLVFKITEQMEDRITLRVPILASPKASSISWGDAKDIKI